MKSNWKISDLKWIVPTVAATLLLLMLRDLHPEYRSRIDGIFTYGFWAVVVGSVSWLLFSLRGQRHKVTKPLNNEAKEQPGKYGIEGYIIGASFRPAYARTLRKLKPNKCSVKSNGDSLEFVEYPFEPATLYPAGTLHISEIAEVNLGYPPDIRLKNGDILFVPSTSKAELMEFANGNDLEIVGRTSIWSAMLSPFLDTWETQDTIERQFAWLEKEGLTRESVNTWRKEVAVPMMAYNFGTYLWEWGSLDLHDVLLAQKANLSSVDFANFYRRAIGLAARDPIRRQSLATDAAPQNISSTLHSVLLDWFPQEGKDKGEEFSARMRRRHDHISSVQKTIANELAAAYSEPHRKYHTLAHIETCLGQLQRLWNYAINPNEVRWALLFHDAIYDPHRNDNEQRSADWACRFMDEFKRPEAERRRVLGLIMATAHNVEPRSPDEKLMLDLDLSILGTEASVFDAYDEAIRYEYQWVPETEYKAARSAVLRSFLSRDRIFMTSHFFKNCEQLARSNIERSLSRMGCQ